MEWREVIVDTGSASSGHTKELAALARSLTKERYAPNAAQ